MSMDGKRFGAGILGGLLLGLVVVASAGFTTFGAFGSLSPAAVPSDNLERSSSQTIATSTMSATSSPTNASAGSAAVPPTYSSTSTTSTNSSQDYVGLNFAQAAIGQKNSNLDNIPNQPLLVNGIVFLPVLVAFVLGAILYRTSKKKASDDA